MTGTDPKSAEGHEKARRFAQAFVNALTRPPAPVSGTLHRDGVSWLDAPVPRRRHRCFPQTSGHSGSGLLVERCPCGAVRLELTDPWMERNTRSRTAVGDSP